MGFLRDLCGVFGDTVNVFQEGTKVFTEPMKDVANFYVDSFRSLKPYTADEVRRAKAAAHAEERQNEDQYAGFQRRLDELKQRLKAIEKQYAEEQAKTSVQR